MLKRRMQVHTWNIQRTATVQWKSPGKPYLIMITIPYHKLPYISKNYHLISIQPHFNFSPNCLILHNARILPSYSSIYEIPQGSYTATIYAAAYCCNHFETNECPLSFVAILVARRSAPTRTCVDLSNCTTPHPPFASFFLRYGPGSDAPESVVVASALALELALA